MQKAKYFFIAFLLVSSIFSSSFAAAPVLTGTHLLDSMGKSLPRPAQRKAQRTSNRFQIGDLHNFKTFNFASKAWEETPARLLMTGDNICLYLEEGREVDSKVLEGLVKEFDAKIYPTTAKYFGNEARPGIDNDNRITILLMDIRDDSETTGAYTSGYFNRADCYLPNEIPADSDLQTNCREMLYADINPSDITSSEFFSTITHELQHLIHFYHDSKEADWLNEGCSQMAPWLCGYGHPRQISAWQKNPDNSLLAWAPWQLVANYGQVYLWSYYVMNRFCGNDEERVQFFRQLVADTDQGMASYDKLLKARGTTFDALFNNFCIAGFLNRKDLQPAILSFGADLADFQLPAVSFVENLPTEIRNNVSIWGADLVKVALASNYEEIRVDLAGDLNTLPNSFSVALVFFNEAESKVRQIRYIENIKSTTPTTSMRISRVMLPGYGDDYYPPPPVKTQMGNLTAAVPAGSDMLYIIIMGKGPADVPDSMLSWSGKATYRLDVAVTRKSETVAAPPAPTANIATLLASYETLKNGLLSAENYEKNHAAFSAVEAELRATLKNEKNGSVQPLTQAISASSDTLPELAAYANALETFSGLHQ